ncbi:hypothetical protein DFJ58DRAFT_735127 [Suillus subalutaceus]|uniref:uncharacterized protein n=1 Tax=Suillus subalutaceus TaxID=48586 RepID=UPI001B86ED9C|nr:uncharacterized protein DFJ58DRAFT_735127 [Suillus subalutaceus]KAG1836201.1 hypothetical protein DFJ58DRAFT_735127 [Suillus subalutaceus]
MSKHFLLSELRLKIGSLHPLGVIQSDISSMDKLTSCELNCLITQETRREGDANDMEHLLPLIFNSFDPTNLPATDTLKDSTNKPLYDSTTKQWSLALPKKGEAIEKTFPFFLNNLTKALLQSFPSSGTFPPLWYGLSSTVPVEKHTVLHWNTILIVAELTTTSYTPSIPTGKMHDTKAWLVFREQPWRHFILSLSFSNNYRKLRVHVHDHSGGIVTPEIDIHENPDTFKYIMMTSLLSGAFWARNIKGLPKRRNQAAHKPCSLDAQMELTQSHALDVQTRFYSLPDQLPSPAKFTDEPEPETDSAPLIDSPDLKNTDAEVDDVIGKIAIHDNAAEPSATPAQRDGEEFIIKDHWVKGDETIVLNEVEMLKALKDIPGVPQYIEHCLVEVEPGKVDNTQVYRQKIYSSTPRKELVKALRDIVLIQKRVVAEHQVLHRDCSLNNSMIEDTKDGSRGALIDWEFAARITSDNMYSAGGTGTIPFMSVSALKAVGKLNYQYSQGMKSVKELKLATDHLTPEKMPKIKHTYYDNLELMFYIFTWICIMFKGPRSHSKAKVKLFFFLGESMKSCIGEQFAPYFKKLVPLAEEWYDLMVAKKMKVEFEEVVSLFNKHINNLLL